MELWGTRDNEKSLKSERELLAQQPVRARERSAFLYLAIQGDPLWAQSTREWGTPQRLLPRDFVAASEAPASLFM